MNVRVGGCLLLFLLSWSSLADAQSRPGPFVAPPRAVRSRDFDDQHIRLELKFDLEGASFSGRAIHTLAPFRPLQQLELDAAGMQIQAVTLAQGESGEPSQPLKFEHRDGRLRITLDKEYPAGESLKVSIDYRVERPRHGAHFVIPDASEPRASRMVWTQSEPEFARYWFPCLDSPVEKVTSEILATVPAEAYVLSNGQLLNKQPQADGTQTWHWRQAKPHAPYLMSVVAGDFEVLEQVWDDIPVLSFVPRGRLADAPRSFEKTPQMLKFFSEKIGVRYPWPKYAQICVDEYMWGGMEHTSATTLNLGTLHDERAHLDRDSDNLVAHELAHQWWGDLLTCKDWGELWLNESFATYFATLWTEHDRGWDEAAWARHQEAQAYLDEDRQYRRPIVNYRYGNPLQMFDRHTYPKGGRVLHALRFELGDALFWKALQRYCVANQYRTVETADLRIAVEEATGQTLTRFFDQWLYHGGHPEFQVSWRWDEEASTARVVIRQTQTVDQTTPLFHVPLELEFATGTEATLKRISVSKAEETFTFELAQRPTRVCLDPQDWILKTVTFAKPKEELLDQLAHDEHILCRVQAAQGLAQFVDDQDVQAALTAAAQQDAFWAVRQEAVQTLAKGKGDTLRKALLQSAERDDKSAVRRAAVKGLGAFPHDETRETLRRIATRDQSYYVAAEALRTLAKLEDPQAATMLRSALERISDEEVILKAACDGLVQLKDTAATDKLRALLENPMEPERRVVLVSALARLRPQDDQAYQQLLAQLKNDRSSVRGAAVEALSQLGNPRAVEQLLALRGEEESPRLVRSIDEAVEKLRARERDLDMLRKQVDELRGQNRDLEERLKKLESKQPARLRCAAGR